MRLTYAIKLLIDMLASLVVKASDFFKARERKKNISSFGSDPFTCAHVRLLLS